MVRFSVVCGLLRILSIALWALPAFGQLQERWIFRSYTAEGRSIPTVNCMAQDGDGMLWLGTDGGLIRYDGNRFRFYGPADGLPPMAVSTLVSHPRGGLWAGTTQGLLRIQGDRFQFMSTQNTGLVGLSVTFFGMDEEGRAWVPLSDGVYCTRDGLLQREANTQAWRYPTYLFRSRTLGGLASLDGEQRLRVRRGDGTWQTLWQARELADAPLWYLTEDASGTLWGSSYTRLVSLAPGERSFRDRTALVRGTLQQFPSAPDPDGCLTILTTSGLLRVKGHAPPFWMPRQEGWPTGSLFTSLVDRDRALWMGGTGLYRRTGEGTFQCFELVGPEGKEAFRSMCGDAGRKGLWIGTSRGLAWWDGARLQPRPEFRGLEVFQLRLGKDGTLWVATSDRRIWRLGPGEQRARPIAFRLPAEYQGLAAGDRGLLYVSVGMQGVLEIRDGVARPLPATGLTARSNITFLAVDGQGRLWASGGLGIQVWDG